MILGGDIGNLQVSVGRCIELAAALPRQVFVPGSEVNRFHDASDAACTNQIVEPGVTRALTKEKQDDSGGKFCFVDDGIRLKSK